MAEILEVILRGHALHICPGDIWLPAPQTINKGSENAMEFAVTLQFDVEILSTCVVFPLQTAWEQVAIPCQQDTLHSHGFQCSVDVLGKQSHKSTPQIRKLVFFQDFQ